MRVCLDTNVLVSGIFWKGIPGKIIDLWAEGRFDLVVSLPIIDEYKRVLRRVGSKIDFKLAELWIQTILEKAVIVAALRPQKKWSRDIDDDKFIECAILGHSKYLVTGDEDLFSLQEKFSFEILSPKNFIRKIK